VRDVLELVVAGFDVLEDEVLLELDVFDFAYLPFFDSEPPDL
jgi:hypothetical protein